MSDLAASIRELATAERRGNAIDTEWEPRGSEVAFRQRAKAAAPGALATALADVLRTADAADARYACWLALDAIADDDLPLVAGAIGAIADPDAGVIAALAMIGRTKSVPPWLRDAIRAALAEAAPRASRNQSAVIDILRRAAEEPEHFDLAGALRHGASLFNAGKFFEAHEAWEDVWRPMHGAERDFFRGLIQYAVAMKKAHEGNPAGALRLLERVDRLLAPYEPRHRGVDVTALRANVAALRQEAAAWHAGHAKGLRTKPVHLPDG